MNVSSSIIEVPKLAHDKFQPKIFSGPLFQSCHFKNMPNTNINNHEKPNKAYPIISHNVIQNTKHIQI
jgi:hypothetical protein